MTILVRAATQKQVAAKIRVLKWNAVRAMLEIL